ncbi:hypothetical protein CerSpe_217130 [Prunus speciosa]
MKAEVVTLLLVNLASIMQRADESLLPGVYKEVGPSLHTDPTGLGSLTHSVQIHCPVCRLPTCGLPCYAPQPSAVIALGAFLWSLSL